MSPVRKPVKPLNSRKEYDSSMMTPCLNFGGTYLRVLGSDVFSNFADLMEYRNMESPGLFDEVCVFELL